MRLLRYRGDAKIVDEAALDGKGDDQGLTRTVTS